MMRYIIGNAIGECIDSHAYDFGANSLSNKETVLLHDLDHVLAHYKLAEVLSNPYASVVQFYTTINKREHS